mgnify:CR=1 FL=1
MVCPVCGEALELEVVDTWQADAVRDTRTLSGGESFLVSLALVMRTLMSGEGAFAAHLSILAKTLALYTIMITGALWEKDVFGQYLFAPVFFWEDVVSFVVIALHTFYLAGLIFGLMDDRTLFVIALFAYATYVVNAAQFLLKLRAARLSAPASRQAEALT